jgi:hypothetical protein
VKTLLITLAAGLFAVTAEAQLPYASLLNLVGQLAHQKTSLAAFEELLGQPTERGGVMFSTSGNIHKRDIFTIGKIRINLGSSPTGSYYRAKQMGDKGWFVWDATAWVAFPRGHHFSPEEIADNIEWLATQGVEVTYVPAADSDQGTLLIHIPGNLAD